MSCILFKFESSYNYSRQIFFFINSVVDSVRLLILQCLLCSFFSMSILSLTVRLLLCRFDISMLMYSVD